MFKTQVLINEVTNQCICELWARGRQRNISKKKN